MPRDADRRRSCLSTPLLSLRHPLLCPLPFVRPIERPASPFQSPSTGLLKASSSLVRPKACKKVRASTVRMSAARVVRFPPLGVNTFARLPTPRQARPKFLHNPFLARLSSSFTAAPLPSGVGRTGWSRPRLVIVGVTLSLGAAATVLTQLKDTVHASTPSTSTPPDSSDPLSALDAASLLSSSTHLSHVSVGDLLRQYVVFLGSSQSSLVAAGPWILHKLEWARDNVPLVGTGLWTLFALSMRETFFRVFVGGATVLDCQGVVNDLAQHGIGCLLNYSAEDNGETITASGLNQSNLAESIRAVRAAALFQDSSTSAAAVTTIKPTLFAIKLSGLVHDPHILARATKALTESSSAQRGTSLPANVLFPASPSLSDEDHEVLDGLFASLREVAAEARSGGVRLLIDAEYAHYQPAIDRYADLLSAEFNKPSAGHSNTIPIVYNTYQTYLRTTPDNMKAAMARADAQGFSFGAKLVRGAYVDSERKRHALSGETGPCAVWSNKAETDACYDECARILEKRIAREISSDKTGTLPSTAVVFASHNGPSARKVLAELREDGLARNVEGGLELDDRLRGRITFAQLFGMADNLTIALVKVLESPKSTGDSLPYVTKYLPYASLTQALPYLIRRAGENQSILQPDPSSGRGGALGERRAIGKELRHRLFGLHF